MRIFWIGLLTGMLCCSSWAAGKSSGKIFKVLPHFVDQKGRHSLSPSLYERDAYQALLKKTPELISTIRFDVQWNARSASKESLKLRIELRGSKLKSKNPLILEQDVLRKGIFAHWSAMVLDKEKYRDLGEVVSWRATIWAGERQLAEQKSFLWQ